jgi:hypothetical protein
MFMLIVNKFRGEKRDAVEAHMAIMDAWDRVHEHWKKYFQPNRVILTDMTPEEFRNRVDIIEGRSNTIVCHGWGSDPRQHPDMRLVFLDAFFQMFVQRNPSLRKIIAEQGKNGAFIIMWPSVGEAKYASPEEFFPKAYAMHLVEPRILDFQSQEFVKRVNWMVKCGHVSA